ncbi:MAG TPA: hypothetical protein VK983_02120, partial [Candidatus Limnocylindrales bacterium]|nr:hypothetical protein [Candidatus Limnocylindrales bacterium]
ISGNETPAGRFLIGLSQNKSAIRLQRTSPALPGLFLTENCNGFLLASNFCTDKRFFGLLIVFVY